MSTDWNSSEPYAPPASSGGTSIWLWLGVGCGLTVLLCCGGGGLTAYLIGRRTFTPTKDPADVTQRAAEIADFELPNGYQPQMAITVQNPFTTEPFMTMVGFGPANSESSLILMQMGKFVDEAQLKAQMDVQMAQQGKQAKHLQVQESRDVEVEIRGKPATFHIQKAEDINAKKEYIQIEGTFEGKGGAALLFTQLDAEKYSEEDAEKLVQSVK